MIRQSDRFSSTRQVIGKAVRDARGEYVGYALELLIDIDDGRIAYMRIRLSGDGPDRCVTVPWSVVQWPETGGRAWRLRVHAESLSRLSRRGTGNSDASDR